MLASFVQTKSLIQIKKSPFSKALVKLNFTWGGGKKSSIQCICSSKQNSVKNNPTILWKSSVVQKTLAALPITSMKPDDAPIEKML
jgi:hypothetical protein